MADPFFRQVKVGDTVVRLMAEQLLMPMEVSAVDDVLIHCGSWTFDRQTGAEVDDDLRWGPDYGRTGSRLIGGVLGKELSGLRKIVAVDGLRRCCLQTLVEHDGSERDGTGVVCRDCATVMAIERGIWRAKPDQQESPR